MRRSILAYACRSLVGSDSSLADRVGRGRCAVRILADQRRLQEEYNSGRAAGRDDDDGVGLALAEGSKAQKRRMSFEAEEVMEAHLERGRGERGRALASPHRDRALSPTRSCRVTRRTHLLSHSRHALLCHTPERVCRVTHQRVCCVTVQASSAI